MENPLFLFLCDKLFNSIGSRWNTARHWNVLFMMVKTINVPTVINDMPSLVLPSSWQRVRSITTLYFFLLYDGVDSNLKTFYCPGPALAPRQEMTVWCVTALRGWRTSKSTDSSAVLYSSSVVWSPCSIPQNNQVDEGFWLSLVNFFSL